MAGKTDIVRAMDYFRRSKTRGGDNKLLARGLLHLVKHLELITGRDSKRAEELLDRAWKGAGNTDRLMADAMWRISREMRRK